MKLNPLIGLAVLVLSAIDPAPATASGLTVLLCTGDGQIRSITIPVKPGAPAHDEESSFCTKACHTGGSRKRSSCHI